MKTFDIPQSVSEGYAKWEGLNREFDTADELHQKTLLDEIGEARDVLESDVIEMLTGPLAAMGYNVGLDSPNLTSSYITIAPSFETEQWNEENNADLWEDRDYGDEDSIKIRISDHGNTSRQHEQPDVNIAPNSDSNWAQDMEAALSKLTNWSRLNTNT
jgi:hypothetical protein